MTLRDSSWTKLGGRVRSERAIDLQKSGVKIMKLLIRLSFAAAIMWGLTR